VTWSGTFQEAAIAMRNPHLFAWAVFLIAFPFYVVPSGLPQPAAWLLILLVPSILSTWDGKLASATFSSLKALVRFVAYVVLANVIWSVVLVKFSTNLKEGFFLSPFFYIYNALLFLLFVVLYKRYELRFLWVTTYALLVSVAGQVLLSFFMRTRMRGSAGFNEANQLGYYALISVCVMLLCQKRTRLGTLPLLGAILACSYLALLSASKAALASIGLLSIAILIGRIRTMLLCGVVFGILLVTPNPFSDAVERAQQRVETDRSLGFFEERGYDRIVNHPEYWVLGSGEGDYRRFADTTLIGSHELHSSLGTLFFCYGIAGFTLFVLFMWSVMRRTSLQTWIVMGPAFAFGMTHQGLRFSLLWVLLATVVSLRELERKRPVPRMKVRA
jgi:hypothetical protein